MISKALRERLRRALYRLDDRRTVPWTDVDVDGRGEPLSVVETDPAPVTHWTGPDGHRTWVIGDD